jgi:2-polyprenyl-3-methyl-5-hydroxy-6-metoxy-1,4-benzoquinol methylase
MATTLKNTIEEFTPPILFRAITAILRRGTQSVYDTNSGLAQKEPEWYDQSFENNEHWKWHYTKSGYYFLWSVIADRLIRVQAKSILDVGCGSGQLAALLKDKGIERYFGIDFSPKRVAQAKRAGPGFDFVQADVFCTELFETYSYDALLATEFLEHVEGDIDIIQFYSKDKSRCQIHRYCSQFFLSVPCKTFPRYE